MTTLALFCILASCRQRLGSSQRREGRVSVETADRLSSALLTTTALQPLQLFSTVHTVDSLTLHTVAATGLPHWQLKRLPPAAAPTCRLPRLLWFKQRSGRAAKNAHCESNLFPHKCTVGRRSRWPWGILQGAEFCAITNNSWVGCHCLKRHNTTSSCVLEIKHQLCFDSWVVNETGMSGVWVDYKYWVIRTSFSNCVSCIPRNKQMWLIGFGWD